MITQLNLEDLVDWLKECELDLEITQEGKYNVFDPVSERMTEITDIGDLMNYLEARQRYMQFHRQYKWV